MISDIGAPVSAERQYSHACADASAMNTIRAGCRSAFCFGGLPRFPFVFLSAITPPLESEIGDRCSRLQTVILVEVSHRAGHRLVTQIRFDLSELVRRLPDRHRDAVLTYRV